MAFTNQYNLYTDPINKETDSQYLILHVHSNGVPIMQCRGTVTGVFAVHFNTDTFKGLLITNNSITPDTQTQVSNCTLILCNGNMYNCTKFNDKFNDILIISCQYPISIGDASNLFSALDSNITMHIEVDEDTHIGTMFNETQYARYIENAPITMHQEYEYDELSCDIDNISDTDSIIVSDAESVIVSCCDSDAESADE
jgi:hypothetical protein